jgi:transposase
MSKKPVVQNEAFRRQTVELLETSGKSVSELARELGIGEKSLYRWRKQYGRQSSLSVVNEPDERDEEIKRLRGENEVLRQERDILKKAISIFSRSQP